MTEDQFTELVARLEREQVANPVKYRRKVILLAAGGYAYIALVLLGSIALLLATLAISRSHYVAAKLTFVVGFFIFLIVRAMWVKFDAPEGREVTAQDAPELFAMLGRLQHDLHVSARFDHVLLTEEFNAAVVQIPRLGILGWNRNYLILGLPLMKALTRKQLAAVLAHELGHLAGGHARLGNWIYRLRLGWMRLARRLEDSESVGKLVFRPFFARYVPYFCAVSFPLARANEYEADFNSARLTSPTAAAAALTTADVMGNFLESKFWPDLHHKATDHARPQFAPFSTLGHAMTSHVDEASLRGWLAEAMGRRTSSADTHPALADRLKALGQQPLLALPAPGEAADTLLGPCLAAVTAEFDQRWQHNIAPAWERRHQQAQQDRQALASLDARAVNGTLTVDERFHRAMLTEDVGDGEAAAQLQLRAIVTEHPDHAVACLGLGARLLRKDDPAGVALVERAIEREPEAVAHGAALLRDFHAKHEREAEATRWHKVWSARQEQLYLSGIERNNVEASDKLEPHGLTSDQLQTILQQVRGTAGVRAAWLVRKSVQHSPDTPMFVLGFKTTPWYLPQSAKKAKALCETLAEVVTPPGSVLVICLEGAYASLSRKFSKVADSRVI